jgi:ribosome-binding factor A
MEEEKFDINQTMPSNNTGFNKSERQLKVMQELKKVAQDFFQKNSSYQSLITVTNTDVSRDLKQATIYFTVFPESKEKPVFDFAMRKRSELRSEIKKRLPMKVIPFVEIKIDQGEKNRQRITDLLIEDELEDDIIEE